MLYMYNDEEKNLIAAVDQSLVIVIINDFKGINIKHKLNLQDACDPRSYILSQLCLDQS
jgi:hypothetical protein